MPSKFCPECGGTLLYDAPARRYACRSCGLFATLEELAELRSKVKGIEEDEVRRKRRMQSEYLEWWLSSKKR